MKFSEAVRLGSLTMRPLAYTRQSVYNPDRGCALGMAEVAVGRRNLSSYCGFVDSTMAESEWPWLKREAGVVPCECQQMMLKSHYGYGCQLTYIHLVVHLFNEHVMGGYRNDYSNRVKPWTLDQLCEWAASVEPKETTTSEIAEEKETVTCGA